MDYKWERKAVESLILLVQEREYLYSVRSRDYLNRIKKAQAYSDMVAILQKEVPGLSVADIKSKWKSLRSQYIRELRLITNSKKSGSGRNELYVPKLWCFDQLSFLEQHACIRESVNNIEAECSTEETSSSPLHEKSPYSTNSEPSEKRSKKRDLFSEMKNNFASFKEIIVEKKKNVHKYGWLGNLVTSQMEEIDVRYQQKAAWEIQSVIQKYIDSFPKQLHSSTSNAIQNSSTSNDLLQMSMEGVFDESDFEPQNM